MDDEHRHLPFRWYGCKYDQLEWLLPLLPSTESYVEPFGGSATVLLNRSPSSVEVFNDINNDVTNFFRVLREDPETLIEQLALTPFSRTEYIDAVEKMGNEELEDIEKARIFMLRTGQRQGDTKEVTNDSWSFEKIVTDRGMAEGVSRWWGRIEHLDAIVDRLRRVQIENREAISVIKECDSEETLFYCDPPKPGITDNGFEMDRDDHRELAEILNQCEGNVAISTAQSQLINELYSDWEEVKMPQIDGENGINASLRVNYKPPRETTKRTDPEQMTFGDVSKNPVYKDDPNQTTLSSSVDNR